MGYAYTIHWLILNPLTLHPPNALQHMYSEGFKYPYAVILTGLLTKFTSLQSLSCV